MIYDDKVYTDILAKADDLIKHHNLSYDCKSQLNRGWALVLVTYAAILVLNCIIAFQLKVFQFFSIGCIGLAYILIAFVQLISMKYHGLLEQLVIFKVCICLACGSICPTFAHWLNQADSKEKRIKTGSSSRDWIVNARRNTTFLPMIAALIFEMVPLSLIHIIALLYYDVPVDIMQIIYATLLLEFVFALLMIELLVEWITDWRSYYFQYMSFILDFVKMYL